MKKTDAIIILDGYGLSTKTQGNAIKKASTPYLSYLFDTYPSSKLCASGKSVGLPDGQMGNSEVGHLNLGAGRIVYQDITMIDNQIASGEFFENPAFVAAMQNAKNKSLHLAGLCSDGGVHSSIEHLFALLKMAKDFGLKNVYVHCITDGRDTPPRSAADFIKRVEAECKRLGIGKVASVVGRFYYMDRDNRWDRVEKGYNCVFNAVGKQCKSATQAILDFYQSDITDEFIEPCIIDGYNGFEENDSFIYYNFRADRAREITKAIIDPCFDKFERKFLKPLYVGMTQYDIDFTGLYTAFAPKSLKNTLGEFLAQNNLSQTRLAETEKYAHVTFFFNGGVEEPNKNETRILIPSPKVATYDLVPQMSAHQVAQKAKEVIGTTDVLILNFANCDMVGHTGYFDAAVKAVETVDECLKTVVEAILSTGGVALILSDHGNAEEMCFEDNSPMTAHTTNPVPLIAVGDRLVGKKIKDGSLCDIAPTFIRLLGLTPPNEMSGKNLI